MFFPKALQGNELDPGPGAYENLDAALRAHLKRQIATLHEAWLPEARPVGRLLALADGASLARPKTALDSALFVLDEAYASPAGLIAALLPALMAELPNIFIVRQGGGSAPLHPALSAALELLGREDVYTLPPEPCAALAAELGAGGAGRVLALGCSLPGAVCLPARLKIGLDASAVDKIDEKLLAWLHPGVELVRAKTGAEFDDSCQAVISAGPAAVCQSALVLDPAYAYVWFWPNLSPDSFRRESVFLSLKGE